MLATEHMQPYMTETVENLVFRLPCFLHAGATRALMKETLRNIFI
jgi:hypothetical protein